MAAFPFHHLSWRADFQMASFARAQPGYSVRTSIFQSCWITSHSGLSAALEPPRPCMPKLHHSVEIASEIIDNLCPFYHLPWVHLWKRGQGMPALGVGTR